MGSCLFEGKGEAGQEDSVVGMEETETESRDLRMKLRGRKDSELSHLDVGLELRCHQCGRQTDSLSSLSDQER